jgi:hypothetical protein
LLISAAECDHSIASATALSLCTPLIP